MIDWTKIVEMLLPQLAKIIEALVNAVIKWLSGASDEQVAVVGKKLGKLLKAAESA